MTSGRGSPLFHQEETEKHKEILRGPAIFFSPKEGGGGGRILGRITWFLRKNREGITRRR